MWIAIKMDCFHPRFSECRTYKHYQEIVDLGSEWMVFDAERTDPKTQSHVMMAYDDDTNTHLSRPY